jgi:serine/threonine protein kinase/tetratricopeptide (TPR) repeat protein
MHGDGHQEREHGSPFMSGRSAPEEPEDFEDSFLREVAQGEPPPRLPVPGERMGGPDGLRFEILEELGGGAMGRVFRARDLELQRVVALKFLLLGGAPSAQSQVSLLKQEALAVAQLDHENIVRLFDVAEWSGAPWEPRVPFLVMEYLEGESLASLLRRERPGLRRALQIMGGIAAGLAHAHARHITHRDLKPGNVLLTRDGGVKLLDFGLAHFAVVRGPRIPRLPTAGTPQYMAPEQWRGAEQDERADIWAAGILLYEMLTGEPPYSGASIEELRARVTSSDPVPSLRALDPKLPEEVERLAAWMLAKAPEQRMRSAAELRDRLRQLEASLGPWHHPPEALMPQRRQVTLVSCWLSRLSSPAEPLDPEDSNELQAAFHRYCSEVIQQHGGSIALSVGDEVLACFGYPTAHEEDSERAVRTALLLSRTFPPGELPEPLRGGLSVRIGVHTDSVVFDSLSMEAQGRMPTLQGAAPRMATWLARQARPGEVVLSGTTWMLVRGTFETEVLGAHPSEGRPDGQQPDLRRVLRERKATSRFERACAASGLTPLVGRARELERLRGLWEQARRGQGALVLLSGEAGIGKSRLIQELREQVAQETSHILRFQCWSPYHPSASRPAVELLQRFFQLEPEDLSQQGLQELETLLEKAGLAPEMAAGMAGLFAGSGAGDPSTLLVLLEQQKEFKRRVLDLTRDLLLRMAEERPVLLSMEDLHWADPSTLELLGFLLGHIERAKVFILLSARPEFRPPWPPRPWSHPLVLDRLPPESTAALVRAVAHGRSLPEELVRQLVARTDGIPLFVEELTRMMLGRASSELPSAIPVTLHELLLARLDALPHPQRALAQLCAVVGRSFSHALLARLSARSEASLRRELSGLMSAALLQRYEDAGGAGYQFRHALIQETAYQSLPRSLRRQHHRRIAQALVEHFPEVVEARPELLAHHFTEAGESEPAIRSWKRAAEFAILRSAFLESISHLKQALKLLGHLPDTPQRSKEELQFLNALGSLLADTQGYGSPELEQIFTRAQQLLRQLKESRQVDPLWLGHSSFFLMQGRFQEVQEVQELAMGFMDQGRRQRDPAMLMQAYALMAEISLLRGECSRAEEYFTHVSELEEPMARSGEAFPRTFSEARWVDTQVGSLSLLAVLHSVCGHPELAWQWTQEVLGRLRKRERPASTAYALVFLAAASQLRGEVQRTLEWAEEARALASGVLFRPLRAVAEALWGWAAFKAGQARPGLEALRGGVELLQELGANAFLPYFLDLLGGVYLELGQVREGLATVAEGLRITEQTEVRLFEAELHRLRGELLRAARREEEAMRHLLRAQRVARRQQATLFELRAMVSLVRQLRELGRPELARRRVGRIWARFGPDHGLTDLREAEALLDGAQ